MMQRIQTFMIGRNGPDTLSRATSVLACLLLILSLPLRGIAGSILWLLAAVFLVFSYWRMLSKNTLRRQEENQKYLQLVSPLTRRYSQIKTRLHQRKLYSFFKCPECGTVLRIPKGKGKVRITCKNCSYKFERNS